MAQLSQSLHAQVSIDKSDDDEVSDEEINGLDYYIN